LQTKHHTQERYYPFIGILGTAAIGFIDGWTNNQVQ